MELKLREDLKKAQLMTNELEVATIRLLLAEIQIFKNKKVLEIVEQKNLENENADTFNEDKILVELTQEEFVEVVQKELKKRRESAQAFRQGNREELAEREEAEAAVLQKYLPQQMPIEELTRIVQDTITDLGAKTVQDMGRVIGAVRAKVGQKAEGSTISRIIKEKLS